MNQFIRTIISTVTIIVILFACIRCETVNAGEPMVNGSKIGSSKGVIPKIKGMGAVPYEVPGVDSLVICPACHGTGFSYKARQTAFIDLDMISLYGGVYNCELCLGKKKVKKSDAVARWQIIMGIYTELGMIDERRRTIQCSVCGGDGFCWKCRNIPFFRNYECECKGSGKCRICYGSGHVW